MKLRSSHPGFEGPTQTAKVVFSVRGSHHGSLAGCTFYLPQWSRELGVLADRMWYLTLGSVYRPSACKTGDGLPSLEPPGNLWIWNSR